MSRKKKGRALHALFLLKDNLQTTTGFLKDALAAKKSDDEY